MEFKEIFYVLITFVSISTTICLIPLLIFIVFPFIQSFTPEKRLEKLINEQCLLGNEIAIIIRRDAIRYYSDKDYALVRAAIDGNEHAIRALKLDQESLKNKY